MLRNRLLIGFLLAAVSIGSAAASAARPRPLVGSWGGRHIGLEMALNAGQLEYDCAHGTIEGPIVPDPQGRFTARGIHFAEHGGPVREGEPEEGRPAHYRGRISGRTLTLAVILLDSNEKIGTFTLVRGAAPRIMRCL
jgi:hypothetical protein